MHRAKTVNKKKHRGVELDGNGTTEISAELSENKLERFPFEHRIFQTLNTKKN